MKSQDSSVSKTLMRPLCSDGPQPVITQRGVINNLKDTTMKELIDILLSEDKSFDELPKWVYIFAIPAGLVLACMIGGTLS